MPRIPRPSTAIPLLAACFWLYGPACSDKNAEPQWPTNVEALTDPAKATLTAPDTFKVKFVTTKGDFIVEVHRDWAPKGADRFYNLVAASYFNDGIAFFRVVDDFMAQFGIHGNPEISAAWREAQIDDDAREVSNTRGMMTFATSGPDSRTVQIFVNYGDNAFLDNQGFAPFGKVIEGMNVVDDLYGGYGDAPPKGRGPNQARIQAEGNAYLKSEFPELDYIEKVVFVE